MNGRHPLHCPIQELLKDYIEKQRVFAHISHKFYYSLDVSLSNFGFEGGKADLAKGLSPSFQVSHAFTLGSSMLPPTYHFASIYLSGKVIED